MSHTLKNLRERVGKPAPWAKKCAAAVPLVHKITSMKTDHVLCALRDGEFSDPTAIRGKGGLDKKLGRKPAVYFFAGHVYPAGGFLSVFVVGPDGDGLLFGKGSPFDSGGILDKHCLACGQTLAQKKQYLLDHECDLSDFREYLGLCLTAHYKSFESYLAADPLSPIDGCNSVDEMDVCTCAFEVRHEGVFRLPQSTKVFVGEFAKKRVLDGMDESTNLGIIPNISFVTSPARAVCEHVREAVK